MGHERDIATIRTNLHTIPYGGGESTSIPPDSPHQITSSTTATLPSPSVANRHVKRRLHMCAIRKLHSSKLFGRSGPTYTSYHMVAESWPLYHLICLIGVPLRLQRRYQAHPLLKSFKIGCKRSLAIERCFPNHRIVISHLSFELVDYLVFVWIIIM